VISAIDTNVLLDVLEDDPVFLEPSLDALRTCDAEGRLIACDVVWAEVAARFSSADHLREIMDRVGVAFSSLTVEAALGAGAAWSRYRLRGGSRSRVVADFLIGAHAQTQADRLVTRDRGFYRTYFADLAVLDPSPG
jgi:predicted nucleic acid-binding protein